MSGRPLRHLPVALLLIAATVATLVVASVSSQVPSRLSLPSRVPAAVRAVAWQTAVAYAHPYPGLPYSWAGTTVGAWEHLNGATGPEALGTRIWVVRLEGRFLLPTTFPLPPARFVEVAFPAVTLGTSNSGFVGIEYVAGRRVPVLSRLGRVGWGKLPRLPVPGFGVVPGVVGLAVYSARALLRDAGLGSRVTRRRDPLLPPGTILWQSPGAGRKVGGEVTLVATPGYAF